MHFAHKSHLQPRSLAILAGAFNPPTTAHLGLAVAALDVVDEVLFAIPRSFPHKQFEGATLEERIEMMRRVAQAHPCVSAAVAEGGLFAEIAREARLHYPDAEIHLLCGRDAAERIVNWDYGEPDFAQNMLAEFKLLVAPRDGEYVPPPEFRLAVQTLRSANFDDYSSTRIRDAIRAGQDWRALTPPDIADLVERIYR